MSKWRPSLRSFSSCNRFIYMSKVRQISTPFSSLYSATAFVSVLQTVKKRDITEEVTLAVRALIELFAYDVTAA